ncbi:hypothetical protein RB195_021926 [Necator americanus]|uniref:Transposase n=1 Tax=Necator americanus TaxID=51031 RepID=A0ABR1EE92_NECAM
MAPSLVTLKRPHKWLLHLDTGDEKWIPYPNIHRRAQWVDECADAEDAPKLNLTYTAKRLCSASGGAHTMSNWELLAEGCAVTADVSTEQLRNLKANLENARPPPHEVYFHHNNARAHIAGTKSAEPK